MKQLHSVTPRPAWRRTRIVFGTVLAAALLAGAIGFVSFSRQIVIEEEAPARPAIAAVALTGGADRIPDAIELLERGYASRLLITGVNHALSRADVVRLAPRFQKLIDCCVDLGYEARNTIGNAVETRRWLAAHELRGPLIVVTSNYHMPRALAELHHELPDTDLVPFPVVSDRLRHGAWWNSVNVARLWGVEYVKYVAAIARMSVRGWNGSSRRHLVRAE